MAHFSFFETASWVRGPVNSATVFEGFDAFGVLVGAFAVTNLNGSLLGHRSVCDGLLDFYKSSVSVSDGDGILRATNPNNKLEPDGIDP
ncbi:hypothetical protein EG327_010448 [Venturia inaequalis]|uniref:Uncharacterized protein n=1 Tax=Venturia inaequalis TaxID=5025 RepID=A0A8H3UII5_VENIN|nr:hypothetical protein EG327_010448 [Venturia inaequalis]